MYECPNCGGNLTFDIGRQKLYCEFCGTETDPYHFNKEKDALETEAPSGEYEVTVFTCPQCGGEIISEDTTAVTFCSFCGGSTILDSRIRKERRPVSIIPFTKTKEDCRVSYGKMLRRAIFAPKELKDEALIEKFRGIYMPYWVYSFEKKGPVTFPGEKSRRRGDYRITEHYRLDCEIEEMYRGLAYDASSTFSDSLSSAIGPFDLREGKPFTPAFLSGFYADTSDVEQYVYLDEAQEMVEQDARGRLSRDPVCVKYHAGQGYAFRDAVHPSKRDIELAMLPVWFLSYRNGDRVSYAVVNGQTGKAAADLPVDEKRYLAGSCFLAVPLFFLLNAFLTVTPGKLLLMAILLAFLCILISNRQITRILARESGEEDKGLASVNPVSWLDDPGWNRIRNQNRNQSRNRRRRIGPLGAGSLGMVFMMILLFYGSVFLPHMVFGVVMGLTGRAGARNSSFLLMLTTVLCFSGCALVVSWLSSSRREGRRGAERKPFLGGHFKEKWPILRKPLCGIGAAAVIWVCHPVWDWFYYIGALVCMGTVLWAILDIIRQHNRLTTRKLPQLNRRGGDEIGSDR